MLTLNLSPATEARIPAFMADTETNDFASVPIYVLMMLSDLLQLRKRAESTATVNVAEEEAMRIDLELSNEAEAIIRAEAERRGLTPTEYVAQIIDGVARLADLVTPQTVVQNAPSDTYEETAEEIDLNMATRAAQIFTDTGQTSYRVCAGLCILLLAGNGCGKAHPVQDRPESDTAPDAKTYLPGSIHGKGWHIPWRGKDLKHPNGPPVKILVADAKDGSMAQQDDNILLRMQHVRTKLFREGKPAAIVQADEITTNQKSKVVIGTGHVIVTSLSNPPDTVITADKMTWDRSTNKVIAIGNAHARQSKPNGQPSTDSYSDRMEYDLATGKLKE